MKRFLLAAIALVGLSGAMALGANYNVTQGSGTLFGSVVVGGVNYAQQFICDLTNPALCGSVKGPSTAPVAADDAIVVALSPNVAGITPIVSAAAESSHVLKASAGSLFSVYASNPSAGGFLMVFNSTTVPADGAVTPLQCVPITTSNYVSVSFNPGPPEIYSTGISAALSSTGCFTKTTGPTGFFHGSVQ